MTRPGNKMTGRADYPERREMAMRPSRYLGYDHDRLGVHLLNCEAISLAEVEFRRAVWLNPFEPTFKVHLAMCLFQQKCFAEAAELAIQVMEVAPDREDMKQLWRLAGAHCVSGNGFSFSPAAANTIES